MQLWMGGIAPLPSAGPMTSIQAKFAVFYAKVDERPSGWYWTAAPDDLDEPPQRTSHRAIRNQSGCYRACEIRSGAGRLH
jgi:hypothetical protein